MGINNKIDEWWDEKPISKKVETEKDGNIMTAYQIKIFSYKDIIELKERLKEFGIK